jgi:hypothetical protein
MAVILEFRASEAEAARPRRRAGRPAEIVIFPGIRYEHRQDYEPRRDALQPVPIRDILKLVD